MNEKISKSMHDCVTELLVSLLGEPSFFFKISADGTKFVVNLVIYKFYLIL